MNGTMTFRCVLTISLFVAAAVCHATTERVSRVIDGDTFVIESGDRVRMIGINAPETSDLLGPASTRRLKELIEFKQVQLLTDYISSDRDRYGRLLRYVALDGEDINLRMVQEGQATAYLKFKFPRSGSYSTAQETAMEKGVGMWGQADVEAETEGDRSSHKGLSTKAMVVVGLLLALLLILLWSQVRR